MVRVIIWAFLFVVLLVSVVWLLESNRDDLSQTFTLQLVLPGGESALALPYELSVRVYLGLAVLAGGLLVMILSLAAIIRAKLQVRRANRLVEMYEDELERLRGPAEDDEVYRAPEIVPEIKAEKFDK